MTLTRIPAPLRVFVLALIGYAISSQVWVRPVSLAPHYVYLAHSLLHGHVDLIQLPPTPYDLVQFNGQWFVAGSPMPSVLMLPFVAIFGVAFSDVLFSVVLGAINVALVYDLLGLFHRRGAETQPKKVTAQPSLRGTKQSPPIGPEIASFLLRKLPPGMAAIRPGIAAIPGGKCVSALTHQAAPDGHLAMTQAEQVPATTDQLRVQPAPSWLVLSESARRWITLLLAFGTPHWYLAALSTYWFTAHIVAVFFILLATREGLTKQRWFLAGLWLACAAFARPTTLALSPFFLIIMRYAPVGRSNAPPPNGTQPASVVLRHLLPFALALLIGLGAHGWYNLARFGKAMDFGYSYVVGAPNITTAYARYGGFNLRFLPCNLAVSLLSPPEINGVVPGFITQPCSYLLEGVNPSDTSAPIAPNPFGMSVFIVTPALLLIFTTLKRAPLIVAAWIGLLSTLLPLWLYHNTGSLQFGYRYVFDAAPMWIILLACALPKTTRLNRGLIFVSIAMNAWGVLWMFEKLVGRSWF